MGRSTQSSVEEVEEDMSLIDNYMESCTILDRISTSDGEGGMIAKYVPGASINAAITHDSTMEAKIAEANGVTSVYTVTTSRSISLAFHDVIRRDSDGQVFRITSNAKDRKTPIVAGIDMAQVSAEAWTLPDGGANE